MEPQELRSWIESRRVAEEREKAEIRKVGPSPAEAIASALALVALSGRLYGWPVPVDEVTRREDELARQRWTSVRSFFNRP